MRRIFFRILPCLLSMILILSAFDSSAKKRRRSKTYFSSRSIYLWEAQLSLGMASHSASYNMASYALGNSKQRIASDNNLSFGLSLERKLTNVVSMGFELLHGSISGGANPSDSNPDWAAKTMSNTFNEYLVVTRIDLINLFSGNKLDRHYSAFVKTGAGLNMYKHEGKGFNLPQEDLGYIAFAIPLGIGGRYDVSENIAVRLNLDKHFVASDQFDSVSEQLNGKALFYETYNNISLGIVYKFGPTRSRTSRLNGNTKQYWY